MRMVRWKRLLKVLRLARIGSNEALTTQRANEPSMKEIPSDEKSHQISDGAPTERNK